MSEAKLNSARLNSARATGFVSAVLLVVLLATSGWPTEARPHVEGAHAASCEPCQAQAACIAQRRGLLKELLLEPHAVAMQVRPPRVLPRQRRVDSWGLPPPRAPCV